MKIRHLTAMLSLFVLSSAIHATAIPLSTPPANAVITTAQTTPKINLNTADVSVLSKSIKGIGIKRAEAIIKYRDTHEGFKSLDELAQVPGLGKNFVTNNAEKLAETFTLK